MTLFPCALLLCTALPLRAEETTSESQTRAYWNDGFRIEHTDLENDTEYRFRFRTSMEFRYTYAITDGNTAGYDLASTGARPGNEDHHSAFNMRRLRFYADGTAPSRDWKYFLHIQLEPNTGVNAHDGYVQWQRFEQLRVQFGRMKVPAFSLEFWQSGFKLDGTDRTIFTGDSEADKDLFGNRTYDFPSGNARLRVGNQRLGNGFATGGLTLYRSQGLNLNGAIDWLGRKQLLAYWAGLYNGRDTRGFSGPDRDMLVTLRLGLNFLPGSDPEGPLGPQGLANYTLQGDHGFNTYPLGAVLLSGFWDRQKTSTLYLPDPDEPGFMGRGSDPHEIENYGFSGTLLLRYYGFSLDWEFAWEEFIQDEGGPRSEVWDRWATRLNLGQFVVRGEWELTAKFAYVVRLDGAGLRNSLTSGLGLVNRQGGWVAEESLQEYRLGVNWYLEGYNQMIAADAALLHAEFRAISHNEALGVLGLATASTVGLFPNTVDPENDLRLRIMYQYRF